MFQPFCGNWVQNVAAFLSKGAANGEVLSHLVSESICLLENHGFYVDVVTSDGGQWNRAMWKRFGLKDLDGSCVHPCSTENENSTTNSRRLWFCSDFSHLVKNLRNFIMSKEEIMTCDGVLKKKHFRAVIRCDGGHRSLGLKIAHKLTPDHIDPKFFQKMHVNKAFDVFSSNVIAAMEIYKSNGEEDLQDCEPTIRFLKRINGLINAMTSRRSFDALQNNNKFYHNLRIISYHDNQIMTKDTFLFLKNLGIEYRMKTNKNEIVNCLEYFKNWKKLTEDNDFVFLSDNTFTVFMVTLTSAIEIMQFLYTKCNYLYLMTSRLNQDALEGMFGMIRECCGSHDKPDPLLFIQVYRLISFYSLVKPPKGSNVDDIEIFETLLNEKDTNINENKKEWLKALDDITERGENNKVALTVRHAHDYNVGKVNPNVQAYFSGFLSKKIGTWTSCQDCLSSVTKTEGDLPRDVLINTLNRGYLNYPSDKLYDLLEKLEYAILQTIGQEQLNFYAFQHIMQNILAESITFVGCEEHQEKLTKTVIHYYAVVRMKIICKKHNNMYDDARKKEKSLRKLSKLVGKEKISNVTIKTINDGYEKTKKRNKKTEQKKKKI